MSSPLPAVIFARDPRKPSMDAKPPDRAPSISPPPSPSSSSVAILTSVQWALLPLLHLLMQM
ncbi:hypothetical protein QJS04_geneDACA022219 [Acorus gramineus]|uniref:Uncharacterized protein n=1 Tax=Acorus gramineus TaxID=55184 RepID=A0AAV9BPQ6_ACOGR|nr:hypothetical protein QJS04_geneDACA022219 [Acorus gramineus]